jgi:two-component system, chemotaxis family, CheB/CheR fusion protein
MKNIPKNITKVSVLPGSIEEPEIPNSNGFPIVGIGASAGGLEALEQFFSNMPVNSGMAFVVIQHLDPTHQGLLAELIQRITKMPVVTATDRLLVEPDSVYIIPPNRSMSILNGALHLFEPAEPRGLRLPVDLFFRSLADDRNEQSIGIILSGMGSDGSIGIKAIKEKDGLVLVQEPGTAKFDGMPKSAIDSVVVDVIASAIELPAKLVSFNNRNFRIHSSNNEGAKDINSLEKVIIILRLQTGHDFSSYKKATMYRRIERRMNIHQIDKMASYVRYLQDNQTEADILFKELLIGVTSFFRNPDVWEVMIKKAIPLLFKTLPDEYIVRAWIPACSTGEEAYSMAMAFLEAKEESKIEKNLDLHIFATDIDSAAIDKARKGIYPLNIRADVSSARLDRFFTREDSQYRINQEIRDMVVLAPHNVIRDPPFTKVDLISCRNLLIYMESDLQRKLLYLFHSSLNHNGLLLLGNSENNGINNDLFIPVDPLLRIYQRSKLSKAAGMAEFPSSFTNRKPTSIEANNSIRVPENLGNLTIQLLIEQFSPASVLVTSSGDIIYITGDTKKYISPAAGKANMNLFAMAAEGLRNELPIAFRKATHNYDKVILRNIKLTEKDNQYADVTIQQIEKPLALKGRLLVIFTDVPETDIVIVKSKRGKALADPDSSGFEHELQRLKEELQSTREEMQITQEEQKSTNEELQSANEELQSTNEELTTSKEEMQSLNEELHTLNVEMQSKIDLSMRLNNDMFNLLNSTEIATLFIDKEFKIRQFSRSITKLFKFQKSDIGRIFTDQVSDLDYPEIYDDAAEVLQTLVFLEKEIPTKDGRWFKIRIMPYRTADDKIDGLVITFVDVTKLKILELSLKETQSMLKSFIEIVPSVIIGLSPDGTILEFNHEAEKLFGRKKSDVINQNYVELFVIESSRRGVNAELKKLLGGNLPDRYINHVKSVNGNELMIEWMAHKLFDENGNLTGIINIGANITKK